MAIADIFTFGSFRLLPAERVLLDDGKRLRLGGRAIDILITLVEQAGKIVRKDDLIARVWPDTTVDEASLRVQIAALRKTLGDGRDGNRFITNIPGRGYSFVASATRQQGERLAPAPAAAPARGNAIPTSLTRIIGRTDIVAALARQLERRRLVTIVGPGGIGKTTIAIAIAEAARASYADGVWFVGLASLPSAELLASAVGGVLGIPLLGSDPLAGLAAWLRDKHALIVLDNCEHIVGAVAALAVEIINSAPRVSVLATSREPLRTEGEWRHRLAPLEFPTDATGLSVAEVLQFPAVQLFHERALANADEFVATEGDIPAIVEICRRLDGVPLALELAAAHVGVLGAKGLAERLDDRFALLIQGRRTALPRHQTLRATLDWSYGLLAPTEQLILRRLAVFHGDFTMDAASVIAADKELTPERVVNGVANLVDKSLVAADIGGDITYYHLLEMTRTYALERLQQGGGEVERIARRHAEYFRDRLERAAAEFQTRFAGEWLAAYGHDIDNVRAALGWAAAAGGDAAIGVALTVASVPLWMRLSLLGECLARVGEALAALDRNVAHGPRTEMLLRAALGMSMMYTRGPVDETVTIWARVLELAEGMDDTEYQLRALYGIWLYKILVCEYRAALALAQQLKRIAGRRASRTDVAMADRMMGLPLHYLGDQAGARTCAVDALSAPVAADRHVHTIRYGADQRVGAFVLLSRVLWLQGFADQAVQAAQAGVDEAAGHANSVCLALADGAGLIAILVGNVTDAGHFGAMLTEHAEKHSLGVWRTYGLAVRGRLLMEGGAASDGVVLLRSALADLRMTPFDIRFQLYLVWLAEALGRTGRAVEGHSAIDEALERAERTEERWYLPELLRLRGELLLLGGAPEAVAAAADHYRHGIDWARRQGALSWELRCATSLARLLRDQGRPADATAILQPVYDRFGEGFATSDLKAAKALLEDLS